METGELINLVNSHSFAPNVQELWNSIIAGVNNENVGVPIGIEQIDRYINVRKGMLITVASMTGAGKSSLVMSLFVLSLFRNWLRNVDNLDYPDIEWTIFSMERSALLTRAKMLAWIMTSQYGVQIPIDVLLSWQQGNTLSPEYLPYIPSLLRYLDYLEDKIKISAGEKSADEISSMIIDAMNRQGKNVYSVMNRDPFTGEIDGVIYVNHDIVARFDSDTYEENEFGTRRYYQLITVNGNDIKVYENEKFYIPNHPKKVNIFIIDHISKTLLATDANGRTMNRKQTNDLIADKLAMLRDYYQCTIIVVSQFNRDIYSIDPLRSPGGVVPQETHIADSSSITHNSDLVLCMLNPARLNDMQHQGYHVEDFITDRGHCTLRTLFVIKNTYGSDGAVIPMNFLGASGYFRPLPEARDLSPVVAGMAKHGMFMYNGQTYEALAGFTN